MKTRRRVAPGAGPYRPSNKRVYVFLVIAAVITLMVVYGYWFSGYD